MKYWVGTLGVILAALLAAAPAATAGVAALEIGDRGAEVAIWQSTLDARWRDVGEANSRAVRRFIRAHGYLVSDGVFGPLTQKATRLYQRDVHVPRSGVVGFRTWKASTRGYLTCCGAGFPTVRRGDWSPQVTWWQIGLDRWLVRHGAGSLIPDGVFGPLTEAATKRFQAHVGLDPDGIAGERSWRRLARTGLLHMP